MNRTAVISITLHRHKKRFLSKFLYAVREKCSFENFQGPLYDMLFTEMIHNYDRTKNNKRISPDSVDVKSHRLFDFHKIFI